MSLRHVFKKIWIFIFSIAFPIFWAIERVIGLAGLGADLHVWLQQLQRIVGMVPDWLAAFSFAIFLMLCWQEFKSRREIKLGALKWHGELWAAQEALVEYQRALTGGEADRLPAKQALMPHLHALCRVLDDENIPHPPIEESLFLLDNQAEWGDFIARLWAVRRNIRLARKVFG